MAKFFGAIGYGLDVKTRPGVWEKQIVEKPASGDVIRNSRRLDSGEKVNNDKSVGNSISVVADAYASEHFFAIEYVTWAGARWYVTEATVESPRLVMRLGGVYNGPLPSEDTAVTVPPGQPSGR